MHVGIWAPQWSATYIKRPTTKECQMSNCQKPLWPPMININAFVFLFSLAHTLKNHTFCFCLPRYQCGMDQMTTMMISPHLIYQVKLFGFVF